MLPGPALHLAGCTEMVAWGQGWAEGGVRQAEVG